MAKIKMPKAPDFESMTLVPSVIGQILGRSSPYVGQLVAQTGADAVNEAAEKYQKAAQEAARKAQEEAMRQAREAQERAAEQAAEAAKRQAEEAARQAQEAAQRQQEEAARQAQEAQQRAAEEAQRAQQEAAQAQQGAQEQSVEAQQKAAEEAQRQAQEQAQRAQQEMQKQALDAQRQAQQATQQFDADGTPRKYTPAESTTGQPGRVFTPATSTTGQPQRPMQPPVINPQTAKPTSFWPQKPTQPTSAVAQEAARPWENPVTMAIRNRGYTLPGSPYDPKKLETDFARGIDPLNLGGEVARMAWGDQKGVNWRQNPTLLNNAPQAHVDNWLASYRQTFANANAPKPAVPVSPIFNGPTPTPSSAGGGQPGYPYPYANLPIPQQIQQAVGAFQQRAGQLRSGQQQGGEPPARGNIPPSPGLPSPYMSPSEPPARGNIPSLNRPGAVPTSTPTGLPPIRPGQQSATLTSSNPAQRYRTEVMVNRGANGPQIVDEGGNTLEWNEEGRLVPNGKLDPGSPGISFPQSEYPARGPVSPMPNLDERQPGQLRPGGVPEGTLYKSETGPFPTDPDTGYSPGETSRLGTVRDLAPFSAASYDFFSRQQGGAVNPEIKDDMVRNLAAAFANGEDWANPAAESLARLAWYRESGGKEGPPESAPSSYIRNWIGSYRNGEDVTMAREVNEQLGQIGQIETPHSRKQQAQGSPQVSSPRSLAPTAGSVDIADVAQRYAGGRYIFGGGRDGQGGIPGAINSDCSAFVSSVWRENGIKLTAHTDGAYVDIKRAGGQQVGLKDAQAGDVVFYMGAGSGGGISHHMGIYAGDGKVLDQSTGNGGGVKLRAVGHAGRFEIWRDPRMSQPAQSAPASAPPARMLSNSRMTEQGGGAAPPPPAGPVPTLPERMDTSSREANLRQWGPVLQQRSAQYDIPEASIGAIIVAENGGGQSGLSRNDNNYFSISYVNHPKQAGPGTGGRFARYNNPVDSLDHFLELVSTSPRYKEAWDNRHDPDAFVRGLVKGGYIVEEPGYPVERWVSEMADYRRQYQRAVGR